MNKPAVSSIEIQDFALWDKMKARRVPLSFDLEITARCNNDCRHCYINLPAGDRVAQANELGAAEIGDIADQAVALGAMWCLITGGEPLLRPDFADIYMLLKRKGLLLSVFTNACLVNQEHVRLFQRYPPRDIEVSVYGVTRETYERVTRRPGSFAAFVRGLDLLLDTGVRVRFKAMALRSNLHEMDEIGRFCRQRTKDYFRFDPVLHLRFDGHPARNHEIRSERLSPEEIVALERADPERFQALEKGCDMLILSEHLSYDECMACGKRDGCDKFSAFTHLFGCGAGNGSFNVSYDGRFRLCSSLWAPETTYDLRQGSLREAWENHVPRVRAMRAESEALLRSCRSCPYVNLCLWCPAHAHLETGEMEGQTPYFCAVAQARAEMLQPRNPFA
ncbi:MAG TPA: radical SAM protein [Anaerolineae bacterium]|nr:radical SAM protein [Anaerolineae bacterium]